MRFSAAALKEVGNGSGPVSFQKNHILGNAAFSIPTAGALHTGRKIKEGERIKIMRRFIFLAVILTGFIFFMGCAGMSQYLSNIDQNQAVIISARIMAREIGCQVAFTKDEQLDQTARNVYESIKNGELSQDAINQLNDLASKHIGNRPTIIPNTLDLMQLAGVTFDADGKAVGLEQVSPHFLAAIESGYLGGFDSCKNALQAGFSESEIIAADRRIRRIIILGQY